MTHKPLPRHLRPQNEGAPQRRTPRPSAVLGSLEPEENGTRLGSIKEDGPIETVLRQQAEQAESNELQRLIKILQGNLKSIREEAGRIIAGSEDAVTKGRVFAQIPPNNDLVLLCTIARIEGLEDAFADLFENANNAFRLHPFDYRDAFGDLLPREFKDIVRGIAYRDGVNATADDDLEEFYGHLDRLRDVVAGRGLLGMPTGLPQLDAALCGMRGTTFLGAHKGAGKTTLMLSAMRATLQQCEDVGVLILSFDESKDRILQRLICMEAGISFRQLMNPDPEAQQRFEKAKLSLTQSLSRVRIVETRVRYPVRDASSPEVLQHFGYDLKALVKDLNALQSVTSAGNVLLCIDLFQKWPVAEGIASGADSDHWRLGVLDQLRRKLSALSGLESYAILVLSEIRKDAPDEVNLDDLKGDGRMTSDADCVLLMCPPSGRRDPRSDMVAMTIRVAKGRDGMHRVDVPVFFDFEHYRFFGDEPKQKDVQPATPTNESGNFHSNDRPGSSRRGPKSSSPGLDPLAT